MPPVSNSSMLGKEISARAGNLYGESSDSRAKCPVLIPPPTNLQAVGVGMGARQFLWEHPRRMLKRLSESASRNDMSGLVSDYALVVSLVTRAALHINP